MTPAVNPLTFRLPDGSKPSCMTVFTLRQNAIRFAVLASLFAPAAAAAELAPWMGSADQTPFQLDPVTMVAVTFAADPLHTGSIPKAPCPRQGCENVPNAATSTATTGGAPKN